MSDNESIYKAVLKRENEMGTAIEEGIAVPHARIADIKRPLVIFGKSQEGIDWNSPDGKPVHFIFLILTPHDDYDTQVQILGAIAKTMSEARLRRSLLEAHSSHDIWDILQHEFAGKHIVKSKAIRKKSSEKL